MLQINPKKIPSIDILVDMAKPVLEKRNQLYSHINRGATQTNMMFSGNKENVQVAFEQQNIGVATGYLGGIEPTVKNVVDDDLNKEYLSKINDILRYNDFASKHLNVVRDTMSSNAHYLYLGYDMQNRFTFSNIDSKSSVAFYDYQIEPNIILLLRQWTETSDSNKFINIAEVITSTEITQYENSNGTQYEIRGEAIPIIWGDVPICSFEGITETSLIEPIIPLVKMYEQIVSNIANMTQYNDDAKLLMIGYSLSSEQFDEFGNVTSSYENAQKALLKSPTLEVDADGDFKWLLKEVNYAGMLDVLKALQQLIMFVVASPDTTDTTFSSAESSLALRLKMFPFEQRVTEWKALYKKQYLRMIEIFTNRLNLLKDPKINLMDIPSMSSEDKKARGLYDFANIEVEINVNIPSDKLKTLNIASEMVRMGIFSNKTILSESGVVKDISAEIKSKNQQDNEEMAIMQTSRMQGDI